MQGGNWRELEAKFQRQGFQATMTALASYAGLILCLVFDLSQPVTVVLAVVTAVSQGLSFYAQYQERECRRKAWWEEAVRDAGR